MTGTYRTSKNMQTCLSQMHSTTAHHLAPQSGLALAAGQQKALAGKGTLGRYVIIYTGTSQQGTLGLDDVQVYAMGE